MRHIESNDMGQSSAISFATHYIRVNGEEATVAISDDLKRLMALMWH